MISYEYQDLFYKSSIDKQMSIVSDDGLINITNTELHQETFELTESLNSSSELYFGSCEAAEVKFTVSNVFVSAKDKWLTIKSVLDGNVNAPFLFGRYKVASDLPTADRRNRTITAYDAMYDILNTDVSDWYNNLAFPTTQKEFRDSFFEYFGVEQEEIELVNDSMTVDKTIDAGELSGKSVINSICEINGAFGRIGRDGKFQYVILKEMIKGLYPSETLYPQDSLFPKNDEGTTVIKKAFYISAEYEDFTVQTIDKLQLRKEENDVGYIHGDGENAYVVQDNFLLYGKSTDELREIAENMYSVISHVYYRPASVVAVGNPCLQVGDGIRLSTKNTIIYTYILKRTLKGIQSLRDTYEAEGEEYRSNNINSFNKSIIDLKGKTNVLTRTVEETRLEMSDLEKNLSAQIQINAEGISTKVSKGNIISEINQTAETIAIKAQKIDLKGLVEADELVAKFATITALNATNLTVSGKANISDLTVTNLKVEGKLDASEFTAENISAMNITVDSANIKGGLDASKITSGTISADRISADTIVAKLSGQLVSVATVACGTFVYESYNVSWKKMQDADGNTINYLGR